MPAKSTEYRLEASQAGLQRELGLASATAAVAGEAIAVGIFLTPVSMAKVLGSPLLLLMVWVAMGLIAGSGAICYGALASRYPEAGGAYIYLREAYGNRVAFLYGWMSLLVMDPGITAALAVGLTAYIGAIIPMAPLTARMIAIGFVWLLALINIRNTRAGAVLLQVTTWLKIAVLVFVPVWATVLGLGHWSNLVPLMARRTGSPPLFEALGASVVAAFFSFGGWWDASKLAGEVRDPARTLPRAFVLGVSAVTLVYVLVSGAFLYLLPLESVTDERTFVAQAGALLFGRIGGDVLAGIVALCIVGSLAALIMAAPRVYFAMARDGCFLHSVASVHPRFGTPARAILVQALSASALVLLGSFDSIIAFFMFSTVAFIGLTVASVLQGSSTPRPILPALLFLALILTVLALLLGRYPFQSLLGALIVLLGLPLYSAVIPARSLE